MPPHAMPAAARSRSASASTIAGSLPPNSSVHGMSRSAHATATVRPVAVDPVKCTQSEFAIAAAPVSA